MRKLRTTIIITLLLVLGVLVAATVATSSTRSSTGSWRLLPRAPVSFTQSQSGVWTGRRLVLIGRTPLQNPAGSAKDVAAAYDPATNRWTRLTPRRSPDFVPGYEAVWTGKQMLAFDPFHSVAYSPATNRWHVLSKAINLGSVNWTGREAIGWGGGCCGDAQKNGSAYNPTTGRYRRLPTSPLGASQHALGAWTGRELILFVSRYDKHGKLRPASVATAAAYDPATNRWHRLSPLPQSGYAMGTGVWDGHELLVVGAGKTERSAYAYDPAANRWRTLAYLPTPRGIPEIGVWAGTRLLLVGGENRAGKSLRDGLAYDPKTDRWTRLPVTPLRKLYGAVAVWTGHELIVTNHGKAAAYTP
jgi:N-acetylneuraminic acid mutarotase